MYMYYTSKLRKSIHQLHCVAVGSVLSICVSLDTWTVVWLHVLNLLTEGSKSGYMSYIINNPPYLKMLKKCWGSMGGRDLGGTKIFLHYRRPTCSKLCFFKSNNHQMGLFLSLKITSTFDAPGICVDIKIQVINVHVYIVARRSSMISTTNYQVLPCILWISYQVQGIDIHALKINAFIFQTVLIQLYEIITKKML